MNDDALQAGFDDEKCQQFNDQGYCTIDAFFTPEEIGAVCQEVTSIIERHPDVWEGMVHFEKSVASGESTPVSKELGVRKLFRIAQHNEFFKELAFHPKMVAIAMTLVGPDVKVIQSMTLLKPPRVGTPKAWHQDNAYFLLTPNHVFGFWVALDDTTPENGCMHIVPGSHLNGVAEHGRVPGDYGLVELPSVDDALPIPLNAGDVLLFHCELYHYSPPNATDRRRRALQYHYASSKCSLPPERRAAIQKQPPNMRVNLKGELRIAGREYEDCI